MWDVIDSWLNYITHILQALLTNGYIMPETTAKAHTSCTARLVIRITRGKFIRFCRIAIKLRRDVCKGIKKTSRNVCPGFTAYSVCKAISAALRLMPEPH